MSSEPWNIAIIGMSGAFPGANHVEELWDHLCRGRELIRFLGDESPASRDGASSARGSRVVPAISCMDGVELFDASFFGITPAEAEITDPQHRILLEHSWSALENAGYAPRSCPGAVGVFVGATSNTYLVQNIASNAERINAVDPIQLNIANGADFLATRISYKLNLRGPSHAVQSACSTSLVAVHSACHSLRLHECDMALAGAVSGNVTLLKGYRYQEGGILSPDGHCRPFDAGAQGTVFGNGVGVVVLKRLEDAIADGDTVHAVIRGSAVNNDGLLKAGFTAPAVEGQAAVIVEALCRANVDPGSVGYVECHGTGTALGDPIELHALARAFGPGPAASCAVGSVKSNVGHLDAAAGITGLIKVVLSLKHKMLPPTLHYRVPNPQIDLSRTRFHVNTALSPWEQRKQQPRRAGVSAFGVGGTNAHVVLEEAPEPASSREGRSRQLIVLSARTPAGLRKMKENLAAHVRRQPGQKLSDVAYTLQTGRQKFAYAWSTVGKSWDEVLESLEQGGDAEERREAGAEREEPAPGVVFLFPGQGAQYAGMGAELYREERVFARQIDRSAEILKPRMGIDLRKWLCEKGREQTWKGDGEIEQTWLAQPALVALEYALAQLWMSWGVRPKAMVGHSVGEFSAACVAGVMTLEEGLTLVAERGRLMQQTPAGAMMAVSLPSEQLEKVLEGGVELAAINAPEVSVVSGPAAGVEDLQKRLQRQGVTCRRLRTSHGFHSALMEGAIGAFVEEVKKARLRKPEISFISSVTGRWIREHEAQDAAYWGRQMRSPVRFADGIREVLAERGTVLLEVGPGQELRGLVSRQAGQGELSLSSMPRSVQGNECETVMNALGSMWEAGVSIDWKGFHAGQKFRRVPLPTYPFERKRYWIEPGDSARAVALPQTATARNGSETAIASSLQSTRPPMRNPFIAPRDEVERIVVSVMEKILGIHPIGVTDHFGELGGDSLAAVSVVEEINARLQCELRAVDFYERSTAREAALSIAMSKGHRADALQSLENEEEENRLASRRDQYRSRRRAIQQTKETKN